MKVTSFSKYVYEYYCKFQYVFTLTLCIINTVVNSASMASAKRDCKLQTTYLTLKVDIHIITLYQNHQSMKRLL